nr:hypothetical protein [Rhizobium giardinii]
MEGEARVAMTPDSATQLQKLGYQCAIETGAGNLAGFSDDAYRAAGVTVVDSAETLFARADVIAKVRPPEPSEVARLSSGKTLISFFYPAQNKDLLDQAKASGANVIAMDMVPRISRAQNRLFLGGMPCRHSGFPAHRSATYGLPEPGGVPIPRAAEP